MHFAGRGVFSPDGKVDLTPEQAAEHNQQQAAQELAHWATKPDTFMPAYYTFPQLELDRPAWLYLRSFHPMLQGASVSTWNGAHLGTITDARVYWHNFGGRFVSIRVKGTNGATYYGRASWDNGNVIKLRRVK